MNYKIYESTMRTNASDAYRTNTRTALLDCERLGDAIRVYTFSRRFIDKYSCIDTPLPPITLTRFNLQGGLIYYKKTAFDWRTISMDNVNRIEVITEEEKHAEFWRVWENRQSKIEKGA